MSKTMYRCGDFKEATKNFIEVKDIYDIPNDYMWINPKTLEVIYKQKPKHGLDRWSYRQYDQSRCISKAGYNLITVNKKTYSLHRLIALACIPNPDNLTEVLHIDGDKRHNNIENLRWGTHSENMKQWHDSRTDRSVKRTLKYRSTTGYMYDETGKRYKMTFEEYIDIRRSLGMRVDHILNSARKIGLID